MPFKTISYNRNQILNSKTVNYKIAYRENGKTYLIGYSPYIITYDDKNNYYLIIGRKSGLDSLLNIALGDKVYYNPSENPYISGMILEDFIPLDTLNGFTSIDKTFTSATDGFFTIKYFNGDKQFSLKTNTLVQHIECIPVNKVLNELGIQYSIERDDTNEMIYFDFNNVSINNKLKLSSTIFN